MNELHAEIRSLILAVIDQRQTIKPKLSISEHRLSYLIRIQQITSARGEGKDMVSLYLKAHTTDAKFLCVCLFRSLPCKSREAITQYKK